MTCIFGSMTCIFLVNNLRFLLDNMHFLVDDLHFMVNDRHFCWMFCICLVDDMHLCTMIKTLTLATILASPAIFLFLNNAQP